MAAIALTFAGRAIGTALGGPIGGAIGGIAGALAGSLLDRALFGGGAAPPGSEGPRLDDLKITASTEGAPLPRLYGRGRLGGQMIWPRNGELEEVITEDDGGGKGGTGEVKSTEYSYFASFAVALCKGEVPESCLVRAWADGQDFDLSGITYRFYSGSETQDPDSLIETTEGTGLAPAYRGVCYIVFERLPLGPYGNRIPQLNFELIRPTPDAVFENLVRGVNLIPGTTEHGYDPLPVTRSGGGNGEAGQAENTHNLLGKTDFETSIDHLQSLVPSIETVCLVVAWFGTDLRAGVCLVKPKIESSGKVTTPTWGCAGLTRATADVVSQIDDAPAFGGTPDDDAVKRAIIDLKNRGLRVMLYPFIMMDIAAGNSLPNPYSNNAVTNGQPVYPWRGRITCSPAAGYTGSVDKTATAATQVATFVGTTTPGPTEWSFRRMILHYAQLCDDAGGVDAFCIGTEMVGLTQVRSSASAYPFVTALKTLAADVRAILGGSTMIGYAADWSEYHSHRPSDGSGDVYFNLDPLWTDPEIDFVGIDHYLPLADWRDGVDHLDFDAEAGHTTIYSLDYLKSQVEAGEGYDYFYADAAARAAQTRTAIVDTAEGKHWVFRQKDIRSWWGEEHFNRPAGVESGSPTDWLPEGKPIILTEIGCPAIDKGANQPNVFYDPKSSESFVPYFSSGTRDDVIQRQYVTAVLSYWGDNTNNPLSGEYSGRMLDLANTYVWAWDARPYPTFPLDVESWKDSANWQYGHWISGRVGLLSVPDMLADLVENYGFTDYDFSEAYGAADGYLIDGIMSFRDATDPLATFFHFDLLESGGLIKAATRRSTPVRVALDLDDLVDPGGDETVRTTRGQETELPLSIRLHYLDAEHDYRATAAEARRGVVSSSRVTEASVPLAIDAARAQQAVDALLYDSWAGIERASLSLMPRHLALEPSDVVSVPVGQSLRELRLESLRDDISRSAEARSFARTAFLPAPTPASAGGVQTIVRVASPVVLFLDLPLLVDTDNPNAGYLAAAANPWPGGISVYRSVTTSNYQLNRTITKPATIGETLSNFYSGPHGLWDRANSLYVRINRGSLSSLDELSVLAGSNAIAVENEDGEWEILQYETATLTAPHEYLLTRLLRGQRGTEHAMRDPVATGARVVVLTSALVQADMAYSNIDQAYNWRYGPAGKPIGDASYQTVAHTFLGTGLRTFAPCHIKGRRRSDGDVTIRWIRRARIGGVDWTPPEVPLSEESERYSIDILDPSDAVLRTLSSAAPYTLPTFGTGEILPSVLYEVADQTDDFGSPPASFDVTVYQIGLRGRGLGGRATINVPEYL